MRRARLSRVTGIAMSSRVRLSGRRVGPEWLRRLDHHVARDGAPRDDTFIGDAGQVLQIEAPHHEATRETADVRLVRLARDLEVAIVRDIHLVADATGVRVRGIAIE